MCEYGRRLDEKTVELEKKGTKDHKKTENLPLVLPYLHLNIHIQIQ